ncbi:MAG: SufD family Fe-S cluster assembly protein [Candidatus Micrarchaeota archaeon]|nr:SufD family Fe-S cluster assembly protein [Candidatus Micrarchaeota archaeon]
MQFTRKDVELLSQSLNEPEWLLEERLYAFSILEEFLAKDSSLAEKFGTYYTKVNRQLSKKSSNVEKSSGLGRMTLHDLLFNALRGEFAKEAFLSKEFKPEKSPEIAFILAFFTECSFYFAEAGQPCDFRSEVVGGISLDLFFLEANCTGKIVRTLKDGMKLEEYSYSSNTNFESLIVNNGDHDTAFLSSANLIGENALVNTYSASFGSGKIETLNKLTGHNAQAYDVELFVEADNNKMNLNSVLQHSGTATKGNICVKGIARDSASVKLDGMIKVDKDGGGAESFLDQHVMLMNPGCHAEANPELEIENNNVMSRHSASVAQIDEEKLFYAESRGLNSDQAKQMLVDGFLNSAVEKIKDEKMKEEILELVGKHQQ